MLALAGAGTVVFVSTDVDDLLILMALFATSRGGRWRIVAGQYVGFAGLLAVSCGAAAGLLAVPAGWVRLLGLAPLGLGVRSLLSVVRRDGAAGDGTAGGGRPGGPAAAGATGGVVATAALTLACGADNVATFVPLLQRTPRAQWLVLLAVFAGCVLVLCATAARLGSRRRLRDVLHRYGAWAVPVVYVSVGLWVLLAL